MQGGWWTDRDPTVYYWWRTQVWLPPASPVFTLRRRRYSPKVLFLYLKDELFLHCVPCLRMLWLRYKVRCNLSLLLYWVYWITASGCYYRGTKIAWLFLQEFPDAQHLCRYERWCQITGWADTLLRITVHELKVKVNVRKDKLFVRVYTVFV